jgi:hypothetical protein
MIIELNVLVNTLVVALIIQISLTKRACIKLGNVFNHEASQNVKLMLLNYSEPSFDIDRYFLHETITLDV